MPKGKRLAAKNPIEATLIAAPTIGRPVATTHAEIELAAFRLFEERGFARTTIDAIASAVGVSKRTIFRYYASKNDIAWGQFADTLAGFRRLLDATPIDTPVHAAVHGGILDFNRFPTDGDPSHRSRMQLILSTPELQAHSVHQYAAWRRVIADYVSRRKGCSPEERLPRLAGHLSLALALTAYEDWLAHEGDLIDALTHTLQALETYLGD